jgi:preprotein translocase subunit YajC
MVTITETSLTGATKVTTGGFTATITSNTATTIKAKVTRHDVTVKIEVYTPSGTATSTKKFTVI